jgi:hypothetical protein
MANAIVAVGIGTGGNTTTLQDACECVGGEGRTAESNGDCKNNHAFTQRDLGIIMNFLFAPYRARWRT